MRLMKFKKLRIATVTVGSMRTVMAMTVCHKVVFPERRAAAVVG